MNQPLSTPLRKIKRHWATTVLAGLLACSVNARAAGFCSSLFSGQLESRTVGVETIHRDDRSNIISIFLPLPKTQGGIIRDLQVMDFHSAYPRDFTISDGTLRTAFISVNLRDGSVLRSQIDRLAAEVLTQARGGDPLPVLSHFISRYLGEVPRGTRLPWDPAPVVGVPAEFFAVKHLGAGHGPLTVHGRQHPTVTLESFLAEGKGTCLPKVLLTSLIMKKLELPHRVRAGGTEQSGHMWIELPDGRHLDPSWGLLQMPTTAGASPGWFRFDQSFLFRNQFFPFAEN